MAWSGSGPSPPTGPSGAEFVPRLPLWLHAGPRYPDHPYPPSLPLQPLNSVHQEGSVPVNVRGCIVTFPVPHPQEFVANFKRCTPFPLGFALSLVLCLARRKFEAKGVKLLKLLQILRLTLEELGQD